MRPKRIERRRANLTCPLYEGQPYFMFMLVNDADAAQRQSIGNLQNRKLQHHLSKISFLLQNMVVCRTSAAALLLFEYIQIFVGIIFLIQIYISFSKIFPPKPKPGRLSHFCCRTTAV